EQPPTNVGHLKEQVLEFSKDPKHRVGGRYVTGIGTQATAIGRGFDGLVAHTWDEKIEEAYSAVCAQTRRWKNISPQAQVSIVGVGYSRGAVLTAGLTRVLDQHGIVDPVGLSFGRDLSGNITVQSARPPLVPPGQTAQAVVLLDPVATSMPANFDARLPPSVISRFAIAAADEQRTAFPHQTIIAPGISDDRRSLNVLLPGGHSNVGGGNREAGLETAAFNVVVDQVNGYLDRPLFAHRPLPADPALYTVYQVRGATAVPGLDGDGLRDMRLELANCKIVDPCRDAEPIDEVLAARFEYRGLRPTAPVPRLVPGQGVTTAVAGVPSGPPAGRAPSDASHPSHGLLLQIRAGVREVDQAIGREYDDASERLSRSLLAATRDNRDMYPGRAHAPLAATALARVDHVVVGDDWRHAFAVQGDLHDPSHRRIHVEIARAIGTPVEQSDAKLEAADQEMARQLAQAREQAPGQIQSGPMH
ncbi:MAG TPA: XVIPCD domain-containing protein, partial [Luteimonas sp.]|nr:XVIPCD domain-containing protein [Luteimonas sp.]